MEDHDKQVLMSDHDLLITLIAEVKSLRREIVDMKDDTKAKVQDHELRLRRIELWGGIALGMCYALQFYFNFLK